MASNGNGGWLGGPKKLWSSLTSEVSSMFTEPQHATNKYDGPHRHSQLSPSVPAAMALVGLILPD